MTLDATGLAARLGWRGADSNSVAAAVRLQLARATLDRDEGNRAADVVSIVDFEA